MDVFLFLIVVFLLLYVWKMRKNLKNLQTLKRFEVSNEPLMSQRKVSTQEDLSCEQKLNDLRDMHQMAIKVLKNAHSDRVEKLEAKILNLKREAEEVQKRKAAAQLHWKENDTRNVQNQIRFVSEEHFWTCSLMRKGEVSAFYAIENWVKKDKRNYRVFAQVCLGEYLKCNSDEAHSSINSKRTDFLIIDNTGTPLIAIEYQGEGHYQENAAERDMVKQIAHDKAGVQVLELFPQNSRQDIHALLDESLGCG